MDHQYPIPAHPLVSDSTGDVGQIRNLVVEAAAEPDRMGVIHEVSGGPMRRRVRRLGVLPGCRIVMTVRSGARCWVTPGWFVANTIPKEIWARPATLWMAPTHTVGRESSSESALASLSLVCLVVLAGCSGNDQAPSPVSSSRSETAPPVAVGPADWPTYHHDNERTGVAPQLAPVGSLDQAWQATLDGAVYGQPLLVGGRLIAATEQDTVYALDPGTGQVLWTTSLGEPIARSDLPCGNIDPLGITGTPAYDPATGLIFVVAETSDGTTPSRASTWSAALLSCVAPCHPRRETRSPISSGRRSRCSTAGCTSPTAAWPATAETTSARWWQRPRSGPDRCAAMPYRPPGSGDLGAIRRHRAQRKAVIRGRER